jgi:hypothetical protein
MGLWTCDDHRGSGGASIERGGGNPRRVALTIAAHAPRARRGGRSGSPGLLRPRASRSPHRWWALRTPLIRGAARTLYHAGKRSGAGHAACLFPERERPSLLGSRSPRIVPASGHVRDIRVTIDAELCRVRRVHDVGDSLPVTALNPPPDRLRRVSTQRPRRTLFRRGLWTSS